MLDGLDPLAQEKVFGGGADLVIGFTLRSDFSHGALVGLFSHRRLVHLLHLL